MSERKTVLVCEREQTCKYKCGNFLCWYNYRFGHDAGACKRDSVCVRVRERRHYIYIYT